MADFAWTSELATASAAVDAAVAVLEPSSATFDTLSAEGHDIKTTADLQAESAMLAVLRAQSDIPVLSEEAGADAAAAGAERLWVVDPLDGTMNFMRGLPMCCTCAALVVQGRPVLGVVHDLAHQQRWVGGPSLPTTCNDLPMQASTCDDSSQAVLATGFPRLFEFTQASITEFTRRMAAFKKVRMIGSAAMALAWTAGGRMDVYAEDGIFLWDVAAGMALVEGAGGAVSMSVPDGDWRCDVMAGSPAIVSG